MAVADQPPDAGSALEATVASPQTRPRPDRTMGADPLAAIRLEVVGGPMDGITVQSDAETVTIGRDPDCNVSLPLDLLVSSHHARIVREGGAFWLEDLGSRNGSYVGERKVDGRVQITPGTLFVLGSTCLEFVPA